MLRLRQGGLRGAGALLAVALLLGAGVSAQEGQLSVNVAGFDAAGWPRAQAVATVLDDAQRPVVGLNEVDFGAQIDGRPAPVVAVERGLDSTLPIAVVLALDTSGSMEGGALDQARSSARAFLELLAPQDSVAVVTFHDGVDLLQPFTLDRAAAAAAIDSVTARGETALYQASVHSLQLAGEAESGRRAVVLLSDGFDNGSTLTQEDALSTAETLGVPVYAIGLGADIDRAYLRELAQTSGGRFAETPSPEGLAEIYQEAGDLLRGQYIVTIDAASLGLAESQAATLSITVSAGGRAGSGTREICPQSLCVSLAEIEDGARIEQAQLVTARIVTTETIETVTFLIDGETALVLQEPPYQLELDPSAIARGDHTLAVQVETSSGTRAASEVSVRTGAAPALLQGSLILIAGAAAAGVVAVLVIVWFVLRRRRGGAPEPAPAPAPETPPPIEPAPEPERGAPRPLWPDTPPAPAAPVAAKPAGRVIATAGPLAGQSFDLGSAPVSMGSGARCAIRLTDDTVGDIEIAAEHARVWIRAGQLMVHELRRLTAEGPVGGRWEIIEPGEKFTVGAHTFAFALDGEDEAPGGPQGLTSAAAPEAPPQPPPVPPQPLSSGPEPSNGSAAPAPSGPRPVEPPQTLEPPNILRDRPQQPGPGAPAPLDPQPPAQPAGDQVPNVLRDRAEEPGPSESDDYRSEVA